MQRYFVKGIVSETTHSLEFSKEQIHQLKKSNENESRRAV